MASARVSILCLGCSLLLLLGACEESVEIQGAAEESQEEKEMIGALQEVLEKLRNHQLPSTEKKFGWVPSCDVGAPCAVRKGARIGRLCSCPRGTSCNLHILKCL
ncbi:cocaine- and amphetamine-regulated transcript protein-like [Rhineura floridana]|uniref:cocaine- and amphetamine-regulated transcript protein-like n=1 Tax=Rhineura floridana TaxID=261503 RepID=UPI002AC7E848|nr:cocaine- and amphetamine-regulated transcript protein-like [Rhineura floridana]